MIRRRTTAPVDSVLPPPAGWIYDPYGGAPQVGAPDDRHSIIATTGGGVVSGSFCWHSGPGDDLGLVLQRCYNTPVLMRELIKLGDVAAVFDTIEKTRKEVYSDPQQKGGPYTYRSLPQFMRDAAERWPNITFFYLYGARAQSWEVAERRRQGGWGHFQPVAGGGGLDLAEGRGAGGDA